MKLVSFTKEKLTSKCSKSKKVNLFHNFEMKFPSNQFDKNYIKLIRKIKTAIHKVNIFLIVIVILNTSHRI